MEKAIYIDERGWVFKVMSGLGSNCYKARYNKKGADEKFGWKCAAALPWRDSFEAAQADLDEYAARKGMRKIFAERDLI